MHFDQLKRREFITLLGAAAGWPFAARAQQPKLPRIGVLTAANPEPFWSEFQAGLREHSYIEGQNIAFESYYSGRAPCSARVAYVKHLRSSGVS
jgi:putative ABC transport system substrate-binding protein